MSNKKIEDIYSWAMKEGFSESTAKAIQNFYDFVKTGKYENKKEFNRWKKVGFIKKDKDGQFKALLDEDMVKGNGISWVMAGMVYDGMLERV